ncbi:chemotaxis protein CheX [Pelosinus sp. sgz500959]|uniref:chemotaxis protein CheX n=1 Tax=Pelosinus sp. sgz500959 TaxID=3242472 RepID=UPI00366C97CF
MDSKIVKPFIDAVISILPMLGLVDIKRGNMMVKDKLITTNDVTILIGLSQEIRGNLAYGLSDECARNIASTMMGGIPIPQFDEMAQSAISELVNMVTANAAINLENLGKKINISPPTVVTGENITVRISQVQTLAIEFLTSAGRIELNVGLEC